MRAVKKYEKKIKKYLHFLKPYYIINLVVTESVTQKIENARLAQLVEHLTLNQGVRVRTPDRALPNHCFRGLELWGR